MEWILALIAAGGEGIVAWRLVSARRQARRDGAERAEQLVAAQAMVEEDTTVLGEQLTRLVGDTPVSDMDEATRVDYQTALDAYESATRAVPALRDVEEVSTVVDTLTTGRFALACVHARLRGEPLPERRTPCFFNPQHGPSVRDVLWTTSASGTRNVPACAQDAARLANGEQPELRRIKVGSTMLPYWEAGAAYLPYGRTWFSTAVLEGAYRHQGPDGGGGLTHNRL